MDEYWPCPACHSLNQSQSGRCYSCRSSRPVPEVATPPDPAPTVRSPTEVAPGARAGPEPSAATSRGVRRTTAIQVALVASLGVVAALALAAGVSRLATQAPPPEVAIAVASRPPTAAPTATTTPTAVPVPTPSPAPTPSPTASPSPTPDYTPLTGRFSGTWLLGEGLGADAASSGAYPAELVLRVKPTCKSGACAVAATLVNPRTGKSVASAKTAPTADGYLIRISASSTDLCRGADGRTVEGGAKRVTSYLVKPFVPSAGGDLYVAAQGSIRLVPNARGRSVGCRDVTYDVDMQANRLDAAALKSVRAMLSPVPLADLIPRPNFTVSISGVRMVYYPVTGRTATKLVESWANTSSQKRYCGTIEYSWKTGDRRTSSCIKASWSWSWSYLSNPWTGACYITGVKVRMAVAMPIARWTGPSLVPRGLVTWWKATQRYVRDHEAGHVAIYRQWLAKLPGLVRGASCASATRIVNSWSARVNAAQEAYDKREYARTDWPPYPRDTP